MKPASRQLGRGGVLIGGIVLGKIRGDFFYDEFLEEIGGRGGADADGGIFEGKRGASVVRRIVGIGNASGDQAAENRGVSGLPSAVVALADDGHGNGVESAGSFATGTFIEVTRILLQEGRQNCAADECASDVVREAAP